MTDSPAPQLRVKDVVEKYGLTERYLRHLVKERRIPHYKIGKNVCFDPTQLDAWFEAQRVEVEQ